MKNSKKLKNYANIPKINAKAITIAIRQPQPAELSSFPLSGGEDRLARRTRVMVQKISENFICFIYSSGSFC